MTDVPESRPATAQAEELAHRMESNVRASRSNTHHWAWSDDMRRAAAVLRALSREEPGVIERIMREAGDG